MLSSNSTSVSIEYPNVKYQIPLNDSFLVSDDIRLIFQIVNYAALGEIVNIFGTFANIVNIIIFIKMGFTDTVNVSLLGLAISDLGSCSTLIWLNLCLNPLFQSLNLPFDPDHIHYLTAGWPHIAFTRITSVITAFITLERCLCVIIPLKVKRLITPKKVIIFLVCTYTFVIASVAPIYYTSRYSWQFDPLLNKSILRLTFTDDKDDIEAITLSIISVFLPFSSFATVIVCTILLVITLRKKAKWRQEATTQANSSQMSSRDTKVSKMIIFISTLFIVCFFPIIILFIIMRAEKEFSIGGKNRNLFYIAFSFSFLLESINSSLNIFIYYNMSSNFRATFDHLIGRKKKQ